MKYNLINDNLSIIRKIVHEGNTITNPSDVLLDTLGIGYYLETTPQPEYNPSTQYVTRSYQIINNKITEVWTIHDIPVQPYNNATSQELIENLNALGIDNFATDNDLNDNLQAFGITNYE